MKYYSLPLRLDQIIQKKKPDSCTLQESVRQNLRLIISTYQGEASFSNEFGCSLWDEEFNIQLNLRWKDHVCDSLRNTILHFEKRILLKEIKVELADHNELLNKKCIRIRRKLLIEITGTLNRINEPLLFRDMIYISPVAQR